MGENPFQHQKKLYYLVGFLMLGVLYLLTYPENRTESDDGYWFAQLLRDETVDAQYLPRNLYYLPFLKIFYSGIVLIGIRMDAYFFLCLVSSLFASLTILLFHYFCTKHLKFPQLAAVISSLFLAFSYGFWRYAVEAEVYAMVAFLLLLTIVVFFEADKMRDIILLAILSSFTVLMYKAGFMVLYIVLPILFLIRKKIKQLIIYFSICTVLVTASYIYSWTQMRDAPETFVEHVMSGRDDERSGGIVSALFIIGSNQVATNFIYGFDTVTDFIERKFPFKVINEEKYIGKFASKTRILSLVLLSGLIISVIVLVFILVRTISFGKKPLKGQIALWTWILIYGCFVLIFDPSSNEPWLMISIPLYGLIGSYVIKPLIESGKKVILIVLLGFFILHNFISGILPILSIKSDYFKQKSSWIIRNTDENDLVGCLGPMPFVRYIRYNSPAEVVNLEERWEEFIPMAKSVLQNNGRVLLTEDVLDPPKAIEKRSKEVSLKINSFLELQNEIIELYDEDSKTYQLVKIRDQSQ